VEVGWYIGKLYTTSRLEKHVYYLIGLEWTPQKEKKPKYLFDLPIEMYVEARNKEARE
jgi:hypothetical protein